MRSTVNEFVYPDDEGTTSPDMSFHSHGKPGVISATDAADSQQSEKMNFTKMYGYHQRMRACHGMILYAALF